MGATSLAQVVRIAMSAAVVCALLSAARGEPPIDFSRQIRPLLSAKCFACHGPDEATRATDLRLDQQASAFSDLGGYHAVVPGDSEASELLRRVKAEDEFERMPPPDSGEESLTAEQIALVERWIEEGAKWEEHWSFVAPKRAPLPLTKDDAWGINAIDSFILAKLESEGLAPSPEADRRKLIRRLTFDLTGLPPTLDEVRAFVEDPSADAYEKVVDRLLALPSYGEHMARYWLDAVRYGDTHGLHLDNYREMWPYRDWVIRAFNRNKRYDAFLVEQLAGDLLPGATLEQRIATGFNRCHPTTNEGGSIAEEVHMRNVADRVSTTSTVMMGLTLGCAECHDHKFDPISQKEFYQLFAFFNSLDGSAMDGNVENHEPTVRVPNKKQAARIAAMEGRLAELRAARTNRMQAETPAYLEWADAMARRSRESDVVPDLEINEGLIVHLKFDESAGEDVVNSSTPKESGKIHGPGGRAEGRAGGGLLTGPETFADLGKVALFKKEQPFSICAWIRTPGDVDGPVVAKMTGSDLTQGYALSVAGRALRFQMHGRWPMYGIRVTSAGDVLQPGEWHHVALAYDGSATALGVSLYVDGVPQALLISGDSLETRGGIHANCALHVGHSASGEALNGVLIDDVRIYQRRIAEDEAQRIALSTEIYDIVRSARDQRTTEQQEQLRHYYMLTADPTCLELAEELEKVLSEHRQLLAKLPTTQVFRERREPREAFVLERGAYDQPGERVVRATPEALPPMSEDLPRNRLGLARWLVSKEHPLTSRVAVNRFWQQVFGVGLVETAEDFGNQGSQPSHPELLDWLAVEFRESGWDVKRLMKMIVMSATYRQRSHATPELLARDPRNRLLARGPRIRLDAEMLRDQALSLSGLLVDRVGGPSVKPPQPAGLWKAVGYSGSNTVEFKADTGAAKIYRRGLYTFWKRTAPPPQLATFDAPSRESCTVRRERTNTPLQALLLMNEQQYVEAARAFAERVLQEGPTSIEGRAQWAFEHATMRTPQAPELEQLVRVYRGFLSDFEANQSGSAELLEVGDTRVDESLDKHELAAWTMVANLILNLDEVITKE